MNWDAIGAIGEMLGAAAVVLTLFYLAIQVRQSTRQEELQSFQTAIQLYLSNVDEVTRTKGGAEIFRQGLNEFDNLAAHDQAAFHSKMHSLLHGFHTVWKLNKAGTLPDYELVAMRRIFIELLLSPAGQQWWKAFKHIPPPHLITYLDEEAQKAEGVILPAVETYP